MIRLDNEFVRSLGLDSGEVGPANRLRRSFYETLELRVGRRLASRMSLRELDQFEDYIVRNDEAGALAWLDRHQPDYRLVVQEEFDLLRSMLRSRIQSRRAQIGLEE